MTSLEISDFTQILDYVISRESYKWNVFYVLLMFAFWSDVSNCLKWTLKLLCDFTFSFKGVKDEAERQNSNFALLSRGICLSIEVKIMFRASFSLRVNYRIFQVQQSSHEEGNRSVWRRVQLFDKNPVWHRIPQHWILFFISEGKWECSMLEVD